MALAVHRGDVQVDGEAGVEVLERFEAFGAVQVRGHVLVQRCLKLRALPPHFEVRESAIFKACTNLTTLPSTLLRVGDHLSLAGCSALTALPPALQVGRHLCLAGCTSLTALPDDLQVDGLLDLKRCTSLRSLPPGLRVKGHLSLVSCTSLTSLPSDMVVGGNLNATGCTSLRTVPESLNVGGQVTLHGCVLLHGAALWDTAERELRSADAAAALKTLQAAAAAFPGESALLLRRRAAAEAALGRHRDALASCEQSLAVQPDNTQARVQLGKAQLATGHAEQALATFASASDARGAVRGAARAKELLVVQKDLRDALAKHDAARALALARRARALAPESREVQLAEAEALLESQRYADATAAANAALRLAGGEDARALALRARCHAARGRLGDALQDYESAIRADPDNLSARQEAQAIRHLEQLKAEGHRLYRDGQFAAALEVYGKCLAVVDPGNALVVAKLHTNRAAALDKLGGRHQQQALVELDAALVLQPDFVTALQRRATLLRTLGGRSNLERAQESLRRASRLAGGKQFAGQLRDVQAELVAARAAEAHENAGRACLRAGDTAGARERFALAIELQPRRAALRALQADAIAKHGDLRAAIAAWHRCLKLDADWPRARVELGALHIALGEPEAALAVLREARSRGDEGARAAQSLCKAERLQELCDDARLALSEGRFEVAIQRAQAALKIAPEARGLGVTCVRALLALGEVEHVRVLTTEMLVAEQREGKAELLRLRGQSLYLQGALQEAIDDLEEAADLLEEEDTGESKEVLELLEKAREIERLGGAADEYVAQGRNSAAAETLLAAARVDPGNGRVCATLHMRRGKALHDAGCCHAREREAYEAAVRADPLSSDAILRLAACLRKAGGAGNVKRALECYAAAKELLGGQCPRLDEEVRAAEEELGVTKFCKALGLPGAAAALSEAAVKKAFRATARKWHPDRHVADSEELQALAEAKMKAANEAYEGLLELCKQ